MVFNFISLPPSYPQARETWRNDSKVSWQLSMVVFLNTTRALETSTIHYVNLIFHL